MTSHPCFACCPGGKGKEEEVRLFPLRGKREELKTPDFRLVKPEKFILILFFYSNFKNKKP
jgi:hypothetical protein